jgi:FkbM family methyltransferase
MDLLILHRNGEGKDLPLFHIPGIEAKRIETQKEGWQSILEEYPDALIVIINDVDYHLSQIGDRDALNYRPDVIVIKEGRLTSRQDMQIEKRGFSRWQTFNRKNYARYGQFMAPEVPLLVFDSDPLDDQGRTRLPRYAYVWLLMKGESYLPGVLIAAYSVFLTRTPHDLVCMVTKEVTMGGRRKLLTVLDRLVDVNEITFPTKQMRTAKQAEIYSPWISSSFTKWECLRLIDYAKVLFLDADKVILSNLDNLFQLPAPAATFSSPWAKPFSGGGMENPYYEAGIKEDGQVVSLELLRQGLGIGGAMGEAIKEKKSGRENTFTLIGTCVLLIPSIADVNRLHELVKARIPFGFAGCNSGFDEQSLAFLYLDQKIPITFIHQRANCIPWHPEWMEGERPRLFHYFNTKPWVFPRGKYLDMEAWWEVADLLREKYPDVIEIKVSVSDKPSRRATLSEPPKTFLCGWCEHLGVDYKNHTVFDWDGRVRCSEITGIKRVAVYTATQEGGLGVDVKVLDRVVSPMPCDVVLKKEVKRWQRRKYTVVFALEHLQEEVFLLSGKIYFIPNVEFTHDWDWKLAPKCQTILCKTKLTEEIYQAMRGPKIIYTGFTSPTTFERFDRKGDLALHLAGSSFLKGTRFLLEAWLAMWTEAKSSKEPKKITIRDLRPNLRLVIVKRRHILPNEEDKQFEKAWRKLSPAPFTSFDGRPLTGERVANIYLITSKIDESEYQRLIEKALFNVAPSLIEGFGHIINEGRGRRQVTITTNAPPMNELIKDKNRLIEGKLVPHREVIPDRYLEKSVRVEAIIPSIDDFRQKLENILALPDEELIKLGEKDYQRFLADREFFKKTLFPLLNPSEEEIFNYTIDLVSSRDKLTLSVPGSDLYIRRALREGEIFEEEVSWVACHLLRSARKGIVIDIGANIGSVTLPIAQCFSSGIVYAFEPLPFLYSLLTRNIDQNNLSNVLALPYALGNKDQEVFLRPPEGKGVRNWGATQLDLSGEKAEMKLLDGFEFKEKILLIKVDVEGAEPLVFQGARKTIARDRPYIIFEQNEQKLSFPTPDYDIVEETRQLGYRYFASLGKRNYLLSLTSLDERIFGRTSSVDYQGNLQGFGLYYLRKRR